MAAALESERFSRLWSLDLNCAGDATAALGPPEAFARALSCASRLRSLRLDLAAAREPLPVWAALALARALVALEPFLTTAVLRNFGPAREASVSLYDVSPSTPVDARRALAATPAARGPPAGLVLCGLDLDAGALLALAEAPWPLELVDLHRCDLGGALAAPALAALARHARLSRLFVHVRALSAAGFEALVEAE